MGIFGSGNQAPREFGVDINESSYGSPYITAMGTVPVQQQVLWVGGFTAKKLSSKGAGAKGGGKDGQDDYSADVVVALCNGPIIGIGDVWSGQSWLGSPTASETYTIASGAGLNYTPVNNTVFYNDLGPAIQTAYSATFNDYTAPTSTVLSGTDLSTMTKLAFGATLTTGTYSINPTGNSYNFSSADVGKTVQIPYTYLLTQINRQETDLVPSGKTITVTGTGSGSNVNNDFGVIYTLTGIALSKVSGTPSVTGNYSVSGLGTTSATYKFATGDINAEVTITFGINDPSAVSPGQPTSLNYTLNSGTLGQSVYSFLTSNHPEAAFGYTGIATLLFQPMDLGPGAEIQENRYEVITADVYGGGIQDCNPITCITKVLTNKQWGLGRGNVPFPTSCMDNGSAGTWGSASATGGTRTSNNTVFNWCSANGYFISSKLDSQDSVSSSMGKWCEAGCFAGFYSEGLLKFKSYGDTSAAGNGCTWQAPSNFIVALDDTCFVAKKGTDPVKITRSSPADAWNTVQITFDNRLNQYAPQTVMESDQSYIDRWGPRIEDPQEYDFIHTISAATFAANLRLKRGLYIRNSYEFTLPYSYSYLEPMDIVTISTQSVWSGGLNNVNLGIVNLPVRIQKIVDDPLEGLHITAEDYPFGAHQPTLYNKQLTTSQPVANAFADPGGTEVVLIGAPSALAIANGDVTGDMLIFGALGTSSTWGSCNIFASMTSGGEYLCIGTVETPGKLGEVASTYASGSDPDTTDTLIVNLVENCAMWDAGTSTDADNHNTLIVVDNEIMSYSALTYTAQDQISMGTYIRRGLYGTTIASHSAGALVMRLDSSVFTYNYPPQWRGQTVFFKFQSVNSFRNMAQNLSTLTPLSVAIPATNNGAIDASSGLIINLGAQVYLGAWSSATTYSIGAFVLSGGIIYVSLVNSNLNNNPATSPSDWQTAGTQSVFLGNWSSATAYSIGNMVIDVAGGGGFYIALVGNTNLQPSTHSADWQLITAGNLASFAGTYSGSTAYKVGQFVEFNGSQYACIANTTGNTPAVGSSFWTLLGSNAQFTGTWSAATAYTTNMIAVFNGNMYQAVTPSTNVTPSPTATTPWILTGPASLDNLQDGSIYLRGTGLVSSQNIVVNNSNFQASTTLPVPNWIANNATLSYETTSPFAGTQTLKTAATVVAGGALSAQTWAVSPGQQFLISAAMKSDGTGTPSTAVFFYDKTHTNVGTVAATATTSTSYSIVSAKGAAPANTVSAVIALENLTAGGAGNCWFDDINLDAILTASTTLLGQGSIATVSDYTFSYASTTVSITWSWTSFLVLAPDGSSWTVAASTGTVTSFSLPTSGTVQTAATPIGYTGLTASTTYNFAPFVTLNANGTGTVKILWTSTSMPTLAQQVQIISGDGNVPCSASTSVTAATPASGSGGGSGGGGVHVCFSPNTEVMTQNGAKAIVELVPGEDMVYTARGTWKHILGCTIRKYVGIMLNMGDGELTTPGHLFLNEGLWKYASEVHPEYPVAFYDGTIHNLQVDCDETDDGTLPDTEHSYTLVNGNIVHNLMTN